MRLGPVPHRAGCSPHTVQHPGVAPPPATRPDLLLELLETKDEGVGEGTRAGERTRSVTSL
jgi:hypothetical protein